MYYQYQVVEHNMFNKIIKTNGPREDATRSSNYCFRGTLTYYKHDVYTQ